MKTGPEDAIQIAFFEWARIALPDEVVAFWIPNGLGKFGFAAAARAKRMGLKPGVSDLCVIWPGAVAFVELKSPLKYPTPEQRAFLADMDRCGNRTAVCRSLDEIINTLRGWGCPMRERFLS